MRYQVEETAVCIVLDDVLSIETIEEQKNIFKDVLGLGRPIIFEAQALRRIDPASLQLLVSFTSNARKMQMPWKWVSPSKALLQTAVLLGMDRPLELTAEQGGQRNVD